MHTSTSSVTVFTQRSCNKVFITQRRYRYRSAEIAGLDINGPDTDKVDYEVSK